LKALNNLGVFYRNAGNADLSDRYFRSMLESPDRVQNRGEYDAIAICNLAYNRYSRGEYGKAIRLLQKGLAVIAPFDPVFAAGAYITLGNCYLEEGNLPQAKAVMDTVRILVAAHNTRDAGFYPFLSKYYALAGDAAKSAAYTDSTVMQHLAYQEQYNASHIFNVEKKLYDAEKKIGKEQLAAERMKNEKYRNLLIAILFIIFLSVVFLILHVRLRRRKNRLLYRRIMEESRMQAALSEARRLRTVQSSEKQAVKQNGNTALEDILQRLETVMQNERLFTDSRLTRKTVAARLHTNDKYLVSAIHHGYGGKTFSEYINMLRLTHACGLLRHSPELSIKEVSSACGFYSYRYFHKLFRDEFGMSPSEFRQAAKE
jgi:AraC-like DNA-binding protein